MMWKYKLELEGAALRNALNNENETFDTVVSAYNSVIKFLKSLKNRLSKSDKDEWEYGIDCMLEDLETAIPLEEDFNYEVEEDNFNAFLNDFYNLCDSMRVWVGMIG